MHFDLITIFPEIFDGFLQTSLIGKACEKGVLSFERINFRQYADPPHYSVDDLPYGGGPGMVLKPEPLVRAVEARKELRPKAEVVLFSCSGQTFNQKLAREFSKKDELILLCGRYEGVDQRVLDLVVNHEVAIGDYVLMGGEVAAMVFIEAATRLVDDVIGNSGSTLIESFSAAGEKCWLEAPQYTRPPLFRDLKVPEVLLSGNHQKIAEWRRQQAEQITVRRRPDLFSKKD